MAVYKSVCDVIISVAAEKKISSKYQNWPLRNYNNIIIQCNAFAALRLLLARRGVYSNIICRYIFYYYIFHFKYRNFKTHL